MTEQPLTNYQFNLLSTALSYYYFTTLSFRKNIINNVIKISTPSIPEQFNNNNNNNNNSNSNSILQKLKSIINYLPIANKSISSTESLTLSLFDLILSRSLLHLLPFPDLKYLTLSTLLSPFSIHSTLPTVLPTILLKQKKESIFWRCVIAASIIASIHELSHLGLIWVLGSESWQSSKKNGKKPARAGRGLKVHKSNAGMEEEEEDEKIWGIEIRGRRLLLPSPAATSSSNDEAECAICLRSKAPIADGSSISTSTSPSNSSREDEEEEDPLELFCTSCSTPIHRSCLLQWWDAVQSSIHPSSIGSTSNNDSNMNEEVGEERSDIYQINIGGTLMWTTFRISTSGLTSTSNRANLSRVRSNNANNLSQAAGDDLPSTGVWGLGPLSLLVNDQDSKEGRTTIQVSPSYIEARESDDNNNVDSNKKEKWYWEFSSETELERVRNLLISNQGSLEFDHGKKMGVVATDESKDPLIAIVESHRPGPSCPNCRSSLNLKIYLVSSLPSTISSTHTSNLVRAITNSTHSLIKKLKILQMIEFVSRLSRIWRSRFGIWSLGEKLLIAGIVRVGLRGLCGS